MARETVLRSSRRPCPPDVMPRTCGGGLHEATDAERAEPERASFAPLAEGRTGPVADAVFLRPDDAQGRSAPRGQLDAQRAYYAWVVDGRPASPLIERAFAG